MPTAIDHSLNTSTLASHNPGDYIVLPTPQKAHRFLELDSLRGLAALAVVLAHFRNAVLNAPHSVFPIVAHLLGGGSAAVTLFFLLSGFVLTIPYLGPRKPRYASFLVKRICRIYLPYAVAIMLAALLAARFYSTTATGNAWIDMTWSQPFSSHLLLQHLIMLGHYDNTQLNTAIWSLIVEMRVSLVFPVIVLLSRRLNALAFAVSAVIAAILLAYVRTHKGHEFICDTLFFASFFILGSLLSRNYAAIQHRLSRLGTAQTALLLLVAFSFYQAGDFIHFANLPLSPALPNYISAWILALAAAVILLLATTFVPFRHLLHTPVLLWLGTRSYSVYLLHATVLFTLIRLQHGRVLPLWMIVPYLATTLTLSELFYRGVELPTLMLGRRLGSLASRSPALHN